MTRELKTSLLVIVLLFLFCGYLHIPIQGKPGAEWIQKTFGLKKGIDLQGGVEVVYRIHAPPDQLNRATAQRIVEKIRKRIDRRGLKEPKINVQGRDKIQIQLAGIDKEEWRNYKGIIERMGHLELREVHRDYPDVKIQPGDPVYELVPDAETGELWPLKKEAVVTGENIETASVAPDAQFTAGRARASWMVLFSLDSEGAARFNKVTAELAKPKGLAREKGRIAIVLDGRVVSAPVVQTAIRNNGQITGNFTKRQAEDLMIILQTGSLDFPIGSPDPETGKFRNGVPEFESLIGPSLGQDAIRRGLVAVVTAVVLVALFLIIYYRLSGLVAVATLILNLLLLLTVLGFLGAVLTLPGIAGIVLTVGMAVDANILVFERIREELAKAKTAPQAFEHGTSRAMAAILDANITTLIAALVLYFMGTGPVKGFAVTLALGILTTLFSVLFGGRVILRALLTGGTLKSFRMLSILKNPNFQFMRIFRPVFAVSCLAVAASIVGTALYGDKALGRDFKGGSMIVFRLEEAKPIGWVRNRIRGIQGPEGHPKYEGAGVQIMADPDETDLAAVAKLGISESKHFQMRTDFTDLEQIKADLHRVFRGQGNGNMNPEPFVRLDAEAAVRGGIKYIFDRKVGGGIRIHLDAKKSGTPEQIREAILRAAAGAGVSAREGGERYVKVIPGTEAGGILPVTVLLTEEDLKRGKAPEGNENQLIQDLRMRIHDEAEKPDAKISLVPSPFVAADSIGPAAARELRDTTIWAIIIGWILMILYIWIRFSSVKFGISAVVPLIHDALVTLGALLLLHATLSGTLGLNFDLTLATLAGMLTIVGYSVNDTVVLFDRIRENIVLMKRAPFAEIINRSINQTLSRTINTTFTTWMAAITLYVSTMTSSEGIAALALPLVIGLLVGTYSSVYIAGPLLIWLYKGRRPQFQRT